MKKTTCRDLRGACDEVITGATPEEMGANSRSHVMAMLDAGDAGHQAAVESMQMLNEEEQRAWYAGFVARFDQLEDA